MSYSSAVDVAELAERHNASEILTIARSLVGRLQELIENK